MSCFSFTIFSPRFTDWLAVGCEMPSRLESSKVLIPSSRAAQRPLTTEFDKNCHRNLDVAPLSLRAVGSTSRRPGPNCAQHIQFPPRSSAPGSLSMPFFCLRAYFPLFLGGYQLGPSIYIERHLPAHRVPYVFDSSGEPGPVGTVMQMAQAKVLFHPPAWKPTGWKRMYLFFDIFLFLSISNSVNFAVVVSFRIIPSFISFRCRNPRLGCPKYPLSA